MTDNPRSILLQRARRRTAAIVIGTLAGTGMLTVGIAATTQQASGQNGGTTSETTSGSNSDSERWGDSPNDVFGWRLLGLGLGQLRRRDPLVMSVSTTWQDWSCVVRVTLATGEGTDLAAATPARPWPDG